jgi:hypothetical protein
VKSRLALLTLTEDVQALVRSGNLTVGYAECMTDLDANRQAVAMRYFSQAKRPYAGGVSRAVLTAAAGPGAR